jgi:hypothetical protein
VWINDRPPLPMDFRWERGDIVVRTVCTVQLVLYIILSAVTVSTIQPPPLSIPFGGRGKNLLCRKKGDSTQELTFLKREVDSDLLPPPPTFHFFILALLLVKGSSVGSDKMKMWYGVK